MYDTGKKISIIRKPTNIELDYTGHRYHPLTYKGVRGGFVESLLFIPQFVLMGIKVSE